MGFRPVLEDPDPWNVFGAGIDAKARFSQEDGPSNSTILAATMQVADAFRHLSGKS
jgi:hypothetical protein